MPDTVVSSVNGALTLVLRRGERMCLLGMNVDPRPADDFVGFAIEVMSPKETTFTALRNRLAFSYPADGPTVDGNRNFPSDAAPFQAYRWIHFPQDTHAGDYTYRVTMMHMDAAGTLTRGLAASAAIELCDETVPGVVDIGFTRNFASSQAFAEQFPDPASRLKIIPANAKDGLSFVKADAPAGVYDWLGGKANDLLARVLDEATSTPGVTLDVMAYDLNEPDFVAALETVAARGTAAAPTLRILIDDSKDHVAPDDAESIAAARLTAAGASVKRHHFERLQHNKVIILKRGGVPALAIGGSTNFSFRGLYIQANNLLLFSDPTLVGLFAQAFEISFAGPVAWNKDPFHTVWHAASLQPGTTIRTCHSPHPQASDLSLSVVAAAIQQATSSVLFAVAFLNLDKDGPVRTALDALTAKPLFSYGIANQDKGLQLLKPDGSTGVVDFAFLADHAPEPFKAEWSGGQGITIHHKFVVVDFNLPTARVFAGSSNLAVGGEEQNGDHLVQISDSRVATSYAVEALRMFDHLRFRTAMKDAKGPPSVITLAQPPAAGAMPWFDKFYAAGSQRALDRTLFGTP